MSTTISRTSPIILNGKVPFFSFRGPYFDYFFREKQELVKKKRENTEYTTFQSQIFRRKKIKKKDGENGK